MLALCSLLCSYCLSSHQDHAVAQTLVHNICVDTILSFVLLDLQVWFFSSLGCIKAGSSPRLLDWNSVQHKLPWNVVVFFGSGFAIAEAAKVRMIYYSCEHQRILQEHMQISNYNVDDNREIFMNFFHVYTAIGAECMAWKASAGL